MKTPLIVAITKICAGSWGMGIFDSDASCGMVARLNDKSKVNDFLERQHERLEISMDIDDWKAEIFHNFDYSKKPKLPAAWLKIVQDLIKNYANTKLEHFLQEYAFSSRDTAYDSKKVLAAAFYIKTLGLELPSWLADAASKAFTSELSQKVLSTWTEDNAEKRIMKLIAARKFIFGD